MNNEVPAPVPASDFEAEAVKSPREVLALPPAKFLPWARPGVRMRRWVTLNVKSALKASGRRGVARRAARAAHFKFGRKPSFAL